MRFHALLPIRDEADIVGQCLEHMLGWADAIYVFDTGSVDDTWEIIQEFASKEPRIKPLRKDAVFFSETRLRGWMFNQARQQMADGDWFVRVDADEFHHVSPPEFVRTRMRKHETCAYHQYYNFCLLQSEVDDWLNGTNSIADRDRPIADRRRWYTPSVYSEPRLCRYRGTMQWPPTVSFPFNAGFVSRERLPIRHYPHRDPLQLDRRCRLRAAMMADVENSNNWSRPELHHWTQGEWQKFVTNDDDPNLLYWAPGTELPEVKLKNHIAKPSVRIMQRVAHQFFLPVLDRRRATWPADAYPQRILPRTANELQELLKADDPSRLRHAIKQPTNRAPIRTEGRPRFHAMLPVRGEGDIIEQSLNGLLSWADQIYVFDTGSVDDTWDIVQELASKEPRILPLCRESVYFSQKLVRGWLFHHAREQMRDGDWFVRVDADEFYHMSPRDFVSQRMRKQETIAYHQYYTFCLLESEVRNWESGGETLADRARPISERRRWYIPSVYSEPRLCRYRSTMQWPPTAAFPHNAGFLSRERIPVRHYPFRDPAQLARRCQLRAAMMADGSRPVWHHWAENDWRKFVTPDSERELKYWAPGTALEEVQNVNHLPKSHIRLMQWGAHQFLLPILDRMRSKWPDATFPQRVPPEIDAALREEIARSSAES